MNQLAACYSTIEGCEKSASFRVKALKLRNQNHFLYKIHADRLDDIRTPLYFFGNLLHGRIYNSTKPGHSQNGLTII